tara:strand:- start:7973 stop:8422 length:450 start_codon:yes stop_codon:yes gene_type:complete
MPANEIITNLWLGNITDSQNDDFIHKMNVVINCSKDIPFLNTKSRSNIRVPIDDNLQKEELITLYTYLDNVTQKIHMYLKNNKSIFVHCYAGKQRSASVVAAYLIRYYNLNLDRARVYIKSKRDIIFTPIMNFKASLELFEKDCNGLNE